MTIGCDIGWFSLRRFDIRCVWARTRKKNTHGHFRSAHSHSFPPLIFFCFSSESSHALDEGATKIIKGTGGTSSKKTALGFSTAKADRHTGDQIRPFQFEATREIQNRGDGGATKELETETARDRDARAIRERVLGGAAEHPITQEVEQGGGKTVYTGLAGYIDYKKGFRKENSHANDKKSGMAGPMRASTNVRMSIQVDYKPDICKDYKETGYCGWGDACKFLHDRGDYKQGWQIDKEWEEEQKKKAELLKKQAEKGIEGGDTESDEEKEEEGGLPFACFTCRQKWVDCRSNPVVTRCHHYFCEDCAIAGSEKSKKCPVCNDPHHGVFNIANEIIKKEKARKAKAAERSRRGTDGSR